jgi:hypothetical protein
VEQHPYVITCPFCWEQLDILLDPSVEHQQYTEDCQVCCHPIDLTVTMAVNGDISVEVERE